MKKLLAIFITVALFLPLAFGQSGEETCTNARVIQMTELGLGDAIIVARIKTSQCSFSLTDEDLVSLSQSGVSDQVIVAMLEASVLTSPKVTVDDMPLEEHTMAQGKTGGRLGRLATFGIKSVKWKAYLQGGRAEMSASRSPTIILELPMTKGSNLVIYTLNLFLTPCPLPIVA